MLNSISSNSPTKLSEKIQPQTEPRAIPDKITFNKEMKVETESGTLSTKTLRVEIPNNTYSIETEGNIVELTPKKEFEFIIFASSLISYIDSQAEPTKTNLLTNFRLICKKYADTKSTVHQMIEQTKFTSDALSEIDQHFIRLTMFFADPSTPDPIKNNAIAYLAETPIQVRHHLVKFNPQRGVLIFELHHKGILEQCTKELPQLILNTAENFLVNLHLPATSHTINYLYNLVAKEYLLETRQPCISPDELIKLFKLSACSSRVPTLIKLHECEFILMIRALFLSNTITDKDTRLEPYSGNFSDTSTTLPPRGELGLCELTSRFGMSFQRIVPHLLCSGNFYNESLLVIQCCHKTCSFDDAVQFLNHIEQERDSILGSLDRNKQLESNFLLLERYAALNALRQLVLTHLVNSPSFIEGTLNHIKALTQTTHESINAIISSEELPLQSNNFLLELKTKSENIAQARRQLLELEIRLHNIDGELKERKDQNKLKSQKNEPNNNTNDPTVIHSKIEITTDNMEKLESEKNEINQKILAQKQEILTLKSEILRLEKERSELYSHLEQLKKISSSKLHRIQQKQRLETRHANQLHQVYIESKKFTSELALIYKRLPNRSVRSQVIVSFLDTYKLPPEYLLQCQDINVIDGCDINNLKCVLSEEQFEEVMLKIIISGKTKLMTGLGSLLPMAFSNGFTPLHIASYLQHEDMVIKLVDQRVNLKAKEPSNMLFIHILAYRGCQKSLLHIIKTCQELFQEQTGSGKTVFHILVEQDNHDLLEKCLYKLERIYYLFVDKNGLSPLQLAQNGNKQKCAAVISNYEAYQRNKARIEEEREQQRQAASAANTSTTNLSSKKKGKKTKPLKKVKAEEAETKL